MKKYGAIIAASFLVLSVFVGAVKEAGAVSVTTANLLKSVTILSVFDVPVAASMKLVVVDGRDATTSQAYVLPALSGNNGVVYTVKQRGSNPYGVFVYSAEGDKIDGRDDLEWVLDGNGGYVNLVGDTTANTWWIIGSGASGYDGN